MTPIDVYKAHGALPPTPIDTLISLYSLAILEIEQGLTATGTDGFPHILRAQHAIYGITLGSQLDNNPMGADILRLLEFSLFKVGQGDASSLEAALNVLRVLHSAFQEVAPVVRMRERQMLALAPTASAFSLAR